MAKNIDWEKLKVDYIAENIKQGKDKPFTLKELSVRWHVSYKSIRNRSSKEGWNEHLSLKLQEQHTAVVAKISEAEVLNEVEIRTRQAGITRIVIDKAIRRLEMVPAEDLTKREAIELLKLGLTEERKAAGLADKFEMTAKNSDSLFMAVDERLKNHRRVELLAVRVLEAIDKKQ
jgi:hypothetical protein